jgi:uncharacterized protein (TIRG00374 family)
VNRSAARFVFALLLAVVVYGVFVVYSGYESIRDALVDFRYETFALALALSSLNYLFRFAKWEFYLKRLDISGVPRVRSLLIFLSGFVLTVTPGKVGEVFKSAVLYQTHGVDPARTAPIVIAERLTDVIAIVVLIVLGSIGFSSGTYWAAAGALAVVAGLSMILWRTPLDLLVRRMGASDGWGAKLAPRLETAVGALRVISTPSALLVPTLLSVVGWGCEGFGLWLLIDGFGQTTSFPLALFIYATATLAGALVPLPGGLGVAEAMFQTQMVGLAGVTLGAATASMLMIRFATLWWAVIVGFVALAILRNLYPALLSSPQPDNSG